MLLNTFVEALTNKLFFDILKMETLKGNELIDTKIAKNSKSVYIMCKMYNTICMWWERGLGGGR